MMKKTMMSLVLAAMALPAVAAIETQGLYEEQIARAEEARIIESPIAGIRNSLWFDYRINVTEARKELSSDLRNVSDTEDLRDAWEEYRHELSHERKHYVREMAERGYRYGVVEIRD